MWTSINKLRISENLIYVLVWPAIFLVPMLNAEMTSRDHLFFEEVLSAWYKTIPYFVIFLINHYILLPQLLWRKRYLHYTIVDTLLVLGIFGIVHFAQIYFLPITETLSYSGGGISGNVSISDFSYTGNVVSAIIMCYANAGINQMYRSLHDEQKMEKLKRHNLQIEMDYLKYQINPHFFMNTLNNIHALIDIDSESAKSAVIELSKMMRYVLYESGSTAISLRNDMTFIHNYIELMRIRMGDDVEVKFEKSSTLPTEASVPPLLFIVFVENAFKHGVDQSGESVISIDLSYDAPNLHFRVVNSLPLEASEGGVADRETKGGIGLLNVRRRLELIYGNNFTLTTKRRDNDYFVHFVIPISV
ncbi:MAG: sensor histidine kinase [Rikenellaceae bacterium]